MKMTLVMLAVTHMKSGICIAGVRAETPSTWVRPVREFGSIVLGDITYPSVPGASSPAGQRRVMRPFDIAECGLGHARTAPPHIEDWTWDVAHQRPRLLSVMPENERADLLDAASYPAETIWRGERSLAVARTSQLSATFFHDTYSDKYEARLSFDGLPAGIASVACTDLKWRALGRHWLATRPEVAATARGERTLALAGDALTAALGGAERIWLALGLGRTFEGRHWPLVVGVHTLPDYEARVDYSNP